jgi:S-DNA-T family DNA segregation ATPase FtsK/SpoIIIE
MNLLLTMHFKQGIYELPLPNEDNRRLDAVIPADSSGFIRDVTVSLEVWNGEWWLCAGTVVKFPGERIQLHNGAMVTCKTAYGEFVVVVREILPGYNEFSKYELSISKITIGRNENSNIRCSITDENNREMIGREHATIECISENKYKINDTSMNGTFVNNKRISKKQELKFGDVIDVLGQKIVFLNDIIAINKPNDNCYISGLAEFTPEPIIENDTNVREKYYQRAPRFIDALDSETIEIETPPALNASRKQPLIFTIGPAFTMILPMAAGAIMTVFANQSNGQSASPMMFMGIMTSVTAAFIGIFWALMNRQYQKKTEIADSKRRDDLYGKYLTKIRDVLVKKHVLNKSVLDKLYLPVQEYISFTKSGNLRLWERNNHHTDFLSVRLGVGNLPAPNMIQVPKEKFTLIDDKLADEPYNIRNEFAKLNNVPVCINLAENKLIGVIGNDVSGIGRQLAVQLAAYHAYTDLKIAILYNRSQAKEFAFAEWLPHVWSEDGEMRLVAESKVGASEVLKHILTVIRTRTDAENKIKDQPLPHYVIFIADPELLDSEAIAEYLFAPTGQMGISTVLLYGEIERLPNDCTVVIRNDDTFSGYFSLDSVFSPIPDVQFDMVSAIDAERFARELLAIHLRESAASSMPNSISFLDMYKVSDAANLDVYKRWLENRSFESMKAIVGYKGADTPVYLDIHQKYHGSHGLVAGTTGSGKSETLQTYILSMAANYDPREVAFILIDYKGGGMAKSFLGLPHLAGIITNLGGNQISRTLDAIKTEINRRQRVFEPLVEQYGSFDIYKYTKYYRAGKLTEPMPHLIIITDEFAELKANQPEFMTALMSAARVGRSLGVHLILATQSPQNSVDAEVWDNSNFRICLRVQNKAASQAMLRRPDAAYINNAGRGFLQVGEDEIFEQFQSGWSGATYEPAIDYQKRRQSEYVRIIDLQGQAVTELTQTESKSDMNQLSAVVQHIAKVAEEYGIPPVARIWTDPLSERVTFADLTQTAPSKGSLSVAIGLADNTSGQAQITYSLDLIESGHVLIGGSGGAGKTTLIRTLLTALTVNYTPEQVNIYICDFNTRTLGVFDLLPHVGGVVYRGEDDKISKLMKLLAREIERRTEHFGELGVGSYAEYCKQYDDVPAIVLTIDNFGVFKDEYPKLEEALVQLVKQSASYGVYIVASVTNTNDMQSKIRQNINYGIGIQLADKYFYEEVIGAKPTILADDNVAGRGLAVCGDYGVLEVQFALPTDAIDEISMNSALREQFTVYAKQWAGVTALRIPQVPKDLSVDSVLQLPAVAAKIQSGRYLPLGYDLAEASPIYLDMADTFAFTVSGGAKSGKTTYLKTLMKLTARMGYKGFVFDGANRELKTTAEQLEMTYMTTAEELVKWTQETFEPEIGRRKPKMQEFKQSDNKDWDTYLASEEKWCVFIGDIAAFSDAVYNPVNSPKIDELYEAFVTTNGAERMMYFFANISADNQADFELIIKKIYKQYTGFKVGLHLGGNTDKQKVFNFELSFKEQSEKLPAGQGHIVDDDITKRISVITV